MRSEPSSGAAAEPPRPDVEVTSLDSEALDRFVSHRTGRGETPEWRRRYIFSILGGGPPPSSSAGSLSRSPTSLAGSLSSSSLLAMGIQDPGQG